MNIQPSIDIYLPVSIASVYDIASLAQRLQLLHLSHPHCVHKSIWLAVLPVLNHSQIVFAFSIRHHDGHMAVTNHVVFALLDSR